MQKIKCLALLVFLKSADEILIDVGSTNKESPKFDTTKRARDIIFFMDTYFISKSIHAKFHAHRNIFKFS